MGGGGVPVSLVGGFHSMGIPSRQWAARICTSAEGGVGQRQRALVAVGDSRQGQAAVSAVGAAPVQDSISGGDGGQHVGGGPRPGG